MIAVVTIVLWLVVLTLGLYAVFSEKGSGDLPAIPSGADSVTLVGTNYSLCDPINGPVNTGIGGTGNIVEGTILTKEYILYDPFFADEGCVLLDPDAVLTYNNFMEDTTDNYILISNSKTLQQLIDHYFPPSEGWSPET